MIYELQALQGQVAFTIVSDNGVSFIQQQYIIGTSTDIL